MMLLAQKIELRPTQTQVEFLLKSMGAKRWTYNNLLDHFSQDGIKWSKKDAYEYYRDVLRPQAEWLKEISSRASRNAIDDLDSAFKHFFRRVKQGDTAGFPKFKKKNMNDSFALREKGKFDVRKDTKLRIEKLKTLIKMRQKLRFAGELRQVTITMQNGKFYASFLVDAEDYETYQQKPSDYVGVDLGVKDFAILSNGGDYKVFPANQKLKVRMTRLKKLQRRLRRKTKGSNRWKQAVQRVRELHFYVSQQRKAQTHEVTHCLTKNFKTIGIEGLNVTGMMKNRKLSRAIADAGFSMFREQLLYKAKLRGCEVIEADRFFPSTKTCSKCGSIKDMPLGTRTYVCVSCGHVQDRDMNAADNLEILARQTSSAVDNCTKELDVSPALTA